MLDPFAAVARKRRAAFLYTRGLRSHSFVRFPSSLFHLTNVVAVWQYLFNKKETDDNETSE